MQDWEKALNKFLERYINKPWFEGAVLFGSHASGNANKFSDIDIAIVASDDLGWKEWSTCRVDGFLIEYIINPVFETQNDLRFGFERHRMTVQDIFAYGVILHDKHGMVKKLRQQAQRDLKKTIKPLSAYDKEFKKHLLWHKYDELQSLHHDGFHTDLIYWKLIDALITAYYDFNCLPYIPMEKIEKILTDKAYAARYHVPVLPDEKFIKLLLACFRANPEQKIPAIDKLYNYVMKSGGGFDINNYVGRRKTTKK